MSAVEGSKTNALVIPTEHSDETLVRQYLQQLVTRSAGEVCAV